MNWRPASEVPKAPGYYVVRLPHSDRPVVLYWATLSTQWRDGARAVQVVEWSGPL